MGETDRIIEQLEKFIEHRFNQMEKKIDEIKIETRGDIERIRAQVENLYSIHESKNGNDHRELWMKVQALESEVEALKNAPAEKLVKAKDGFLKGGQDIFTKAFWGIALAFVGFLIWDFIRNGGVHP